MFISFLQLKMSVETVRRADSALLMGNDDIPFDERWNRMKPVIQKLLSLEDVPRYVLIFHYFSNGKLNPIKIIYSPEKDRYLVK